MHVISLPVIFIFLSYERKEASIRVTTVEQYCWYSSFLQEAEFNKVMMVPSSEQLQSGKWACDLTTH